MTTPIVILVYVGCHPTFEIQFASHSCEPTYFEQPPFVYIFPTCHVRASRLHQTCFLLLRLLLPLILVLIPVLNREFQRSVGTAGTNCECMLFAERHKHLTSGVATCFGMFVLNVALGQQPMTGGMRWTEEVIGQESHKTICFRQNHGVNLAMDFEADCDKMDLHCFPC